MGWAWSLGHPFSASPGPALSLLTAQSPLEPQGGRTATKASPLRDRRRARCRSVLRCCAHLGEQVSVFSGLWFLTT
jgi:hypothetical protein